MVGAWGHTFREAQTAWVTEINLFIRIANPVTLTLGEIGNLPPPNTIIKLFRQYHSDRVRIATEMTKKKKKIARQSYLICKDFVSTG